jgi:hypothetical protein
MSTIPKRFGDWAVEIAPDTIPHMVPVNDFGEHFWEECACHPELRDGMCVHNSHDGREAFETGRRRPS